jgi:AbrB family looped-hinge helix DNA binding protein
VSPVLEGVDASISQLQLWRVSNGQNVSPQDQSSPNKPRFSDVFISARCFLFCKVELALMETVTVSSKGQVTIPSRLRKELKIVKGEKLLIFREGNSIKMIPVPRLSNLEAWKKKYSRRKNLP